MCGRFAVWRQRVEDEVAAAYPFLNPQPYQPPPQEEEEEQAEPPVFHPRYNIAPRSLSPVIRRVQVHDNAQDVFQLMQWGVIPHWGKSAANHSNLSTINARSEALIDGESGLWSQLKGKKRCVIPVDGYYEWLKKDNKTRIPYYTKHLDGRPMLFAGLWEHTYMDTDIRPQTSSSSSQAQSKPFPSMKMDKSGYSHKAEVDQRQAARRLFTFAIITTSSNAQLSFIHDRMPVILTSENDIADWLDTELHWSAALAKILKPYEGTLDCYQVPQEVGKVGTQDPSFVKPVTERKDGIVAMFKKQERSQPTSDLKKRKASTPDAGPSASLPSASGSPKRKRGDDTDEDNGVIDADTIQERERDDRASEISETNAPLPKEIHMPKATKANKRANTQVSTHDGVVVSKRTPSPVPKSSQVSSASFLLLLCYQTHGQTLATRRYR
ncbi:hypothetical protein FRB93_006564 [Tulasnella sp. JGI-2019a]|nr:hypothetical protein FRB93_006564 [Tulasnella sp. JGI-2019a]